jgi:type I restriction enzyme M protein
LGFLPCLNKPSRTSTTSWKEAGCTTELDYTEQTSWLLFLKYLDALEQDKATEAALEARSATASSWTNPTAGKAGPRPRAKTASSTTTRPMTGDDLRDFVNRKLFPYLHGFKQRASGPNTIEYKIGEIFGEIKNKIQSGYNLRESSTTSTNCASARRPRSTSCRTCTKPRSRTWATPGATAASTTRPRPLIRAMVRW